MKNKPLTAHRTLSPILILTLLLAASTGLVRTTNSFEFLTSGICG